MKIKCVKIISPTTGEDLGAKSPWLTVGKTYVVLALTLQFGIPVRALIEDDSNGEPTDFSIDQFEVIDDSEPSNWIVKQGDRGISWKSPNAWLDADFWDKFDEGEESAVRNYFEERLRIISSD